MSSLSFIFKVFQSRRLLAVYYFVDSPSLSADGRRRGRYRVPPKRFLCACVQRRPYIFPFHPLLKPTKRKKRDGGGERTECVRALDANLDVGRLDWRLHPKSCQTSSVFVRWLLLLLLLSSTPFPPPYISLIALYIFSLIRYFLSFFQR